MTCTVTKLRRAAATPHTMVSRVCCTHVRRPIPVTYEPETVSILEAADIFEDDSGTIYTGISGLELYTELDARIVSTKTLFGLTLGDESLQDYFTCFYLMLGDDATQQAKNGSNLSIYDLVFFGGVTFDNTGCTPNGTNGYADTLFPMSGSNPRNYSIHYFCKTNTDGLYTDFGSLDGANGQYLFRSRNSNNINSFGGNNGVVGISANANSIGFYSMTCDNSAVAYSVYKNGVLVDTYATTQEVVPSTQNMLVGCYNNFGSPLQYSPRKFSMFFMNPILGMSAANVANLYVIWSGFDTFLGR